MNSITGAPSMSMRSWSCVMNVVGLSCTTAWTVMRCFRYSMKRFRNAQKCSARRMLPGTCAQTGKALTSETTPSCYRKLGKRLADSRQTDTGST